MYIFSQRIRKSTFSLQPKRKVIKDHHFIGQWKCSGKEQIVNASDGRELGNKRKLIFYDANNQRTQWQTEEFILHGVPHHQRALGTSKT